MTTPNPNIEYYEPEKVYTKLGRSLRTKLTPLDKRLWDMMPLQETSEAPATTTQTTSLAVPTTPHTTVASLATHSSAPNKFSSAGVAKKADELKPDRVQFHQVHWWELKHSDGKVTYGMDDFLKLLKTKIDTDRFEEERNGATASFETKAINDLLVPVPNAIATYAFPRTEEDVSLHVNCDIISPVFQALGKVICAIQPYTTRKQQANFGKSVMLECRSEVHKSTIHGSPVRVDLLIGFFAKEVLAAMMEEGSEGEQVANKPQSSSKGTKVEDIYTSFVEVKKRGVVLMEHFKDIQTRFEGWGKLKGGRKQDDLNKWSTLIPTSNPLHFIYPQVLRYNEAYDTKYGALTDHDLTTLIYVKPCELEGRLDVYWSHVPQENVRFAFAFYNWLALKAKGMDHMGILRGRK
ncbi:hypothetical protein BT69DRAFT_1366193 [Atractiella rhizophila]|nr:hypothetical protein BT69DRAFT_1366193 [Atractiella rhizophila]